MSDVLHLEGEEQPDMGRDQSMAHGSKFWLLIYHFSWMNPLSSCSCTSFLSILDDFHSYFQIFWHILVYVPCTRVALVLWFNKLFLSYKNHSYFLFYSLVCVASCLNLKTFNMSLTIYCP